MTRALWAISLLMGLSACGPSLKPPRHLVLVTIDTLRADRLGCYGARDAETPNLDRLAQEGAMAVRATAQVPLTRPSHTSLFTGMFPTRHGIRDNITPAKIPEVPTLAEVLKAAGFRTAAFVSTIVLAGGGGLERGFEVYSDDFGDRAGSEEAFLNELQRRGDETLSEAVRWLRSNRESRLFAWVHLYDPHHPYEAPEPYGSRFADRPYDGEVAWSDELVGRLDETLGELGIRDDTLLVVTSDHGEGLGEHRETLHGFFIYETTLAVPLILRGPNVVPGTRIESLVQTVDLFPTLLEMLGIERPANAEVSGVSLAAALRGEPYRIEPVAYAESLVPLLHFGWSDLRSIRRGKWKYIQAPRPELYDLEADPMEIQNVAAAHPDLVKGMRGALGDELDRERAVKSAEPSSLPQDLLDKLGALGYVGSGAPVQSSTPGADPKDKVDEFRAANELIREGILRLHQKDFAGSVERYRKILDLGIESFEIHLNLARGLLGLERYAEAEAQFEEAARLLPTHDGAWEGLAQARSARGHLEGALSALEEGLTRLPQNAGLHQQKGAILLQMGRTDASRDAYEQAVTLSPNDALLRARYGELLRGLGRIDESIAELRKATEIAPQEASFWNSLGMTLGGNARLPEAESAFRKAVELERDNPRYAFNLGLILFRQERPEEARPFFETALKLQPRFEEARRYLAEIEGSP
jgi:arylsulfatase A-like enzyme/tetratricopeptide (TPR) repeat protein